MIKIRIDTSLLTRISFPDRNSLFYRNIAKLCLALLLLFSSGATLKISANTPDKNFHLYLLVGQSNMAGRGKADNLSYPKNPRLLMLTEQNEWVTAQDPLHFDKPKVTGVGPGLAFGQKMLGYESDSDVKIGLIPCAVGGTTIDMWQPGKDAYDDAIKRLHAAMQNGVVKGIIWHQGESDSDEEKSEVYLDKLKKLIELFREEIGNSEVPFVAGELGYYRDNYLLINNKLKNLPTVVPHTAVATSIGLIHNGDGTHLDSESARRLGQRMAISMYELQLRNDNKSYAGGTNWMSLFKSAGDTVNWTSNKQTPFPNEGWIVKKSELVLLSERKGGDIFTKRKFADFELKLEFKMTRLVNSGVKYFVNQLENRDNKRMEWIGFEYQIIDDFHQDEIRGFDDEKGSTAALYLLYAPSENKKLNPLGEWNSLKIRVQGNKIEHWLNGDIVLDIDISTEEFRELVSETKFKNYSEFGKKKDGYILIQDHGDQISFRNIMIREL